jgi:exonuclease III
MKIISWNVANRIKKQSLQLEALISRKPDIIGLQEITNRTLPLWSKDFKQAGYKHIISSFDIPKRDVNSVGPRKYGILIASRWPLKPIDQSLLKIPWPERLVSVLIHYPLTNFEFHVAHIPCGSSHGWLKIDTFEGIYNYLARNNKYLRILCGDFNSPQVETIEGKVITWGQKILKNGQVVIANKYRRGNAWDKGERNVIEGLAEYDLHDMFRLLNGYEANDFSWILTRKVKVIAKRRFDHIFASKELNPKECHYLHSFRENGLSDHAAIEGIFG